MKGFDNKALILFPKIDNYASRSAGYKYQFLTAVKNLTSYLRSMDIEPHAFYTDDIARDMKKNGVDLTYVSTLSRADTFFIKKYCDGCGDAQDACQILFDDIYNEVTAKDPGSLDMSVEDRFEMVLRHASKAASKIIPKYKIVIHFIVPKKTQYKVAIKPNDGKIRINVSASTFAPTVYIGGYEEDACDLLNVPYANRSLVNWEVNA